MKCSIWAFGRYQAIISRVPETRQTLLFSATMPEAIKRIGVQFMKRARTR